VTINCDRDRGERDEDASGSDCPGRECWVGLIRELNRLVPTEDPTTVRGKDSPN